MHWIVVLGIGAHAAPTPDSLAIYPGFERTDLPLSVERTLAAAQRCVDRGPVAADGITTTETSVAHLATKVAYGQPVTMLQREVERPCYAEPLTECRFLHVWTKESPSLVHSTIQCTGSPDKDDDIYVVSSTWDLSKAKRAGSEARSLQTTAVWFRTTTFPGTELSAYASEKRATLRLLQPPLVNKFDSFESTDLAQDIGLTVGDLEGLSRSVHLLACAATGLGDCTQTLAEARPPR